MFKYYDYYNFDIVSITLRNDKTGDEKILNTYDFDSDGVFYFNVLKFMPEEDIRDFAEDELDMIDEDECDECEDCDCDENVFEQSYRDEQINLITEHITKGTFSYEDIDKIFEYVKQIERKR
jgi:ferredoxin